MEHKDKDKEKKSDEVSRSSSEEEKIEELKNQNSRLAERKGQRSAFPFKRKKI